MRIYVNLSDEMVNDLDKLKNRYGISRSGLCAMLIGQGISSHLEAYEILQNPAKLSESMADMMAAAKFLEDVKKQS